MTAMAQTQQSPSHSPLNPNAYEFVPKFEFDDNTTTSISTANDNDFRPVKKEEYNHDLILVGLVKSQVEYHFSDANLSMDNYLLSRMSEDDDYWVPVSTIANLTKILQLTSDIKIVLKALSTSDMLILNEDQTKVKRPNFVPPKPKQRKDLRRTVFIYGLPPNITREEIAELGCDFGNVKSIIFDDETDGPNREVAEIVMARKFSPRPMAFSTTNNGVTMGPIQPVSPTGHPLPNPNGVINDYSHLKTCFVVFESQSQANKLVKQRVRAEDGVRALHQYDFNRAIKKVASAKARGVSPLFSPANLSLTSPGLIPLSPPMQSLMISSPALIHQNQFNFDTTTAAAAATVTTGSNVNGGNNNQRFSMTPKLNRPKTAPQNGKYYKNHPQQNFHRRFSYNNTVSNSHNHHYKNNQQTQQQSQSTRYTPPHRSQSSRFSNLIDSDLSQHHHHKHQQSSRRSSHFAQSTRTSKHFSFARASGGNGSTTTRIVGRGHHDKTRRSSQHVAKGPSADGKKGFDWSRSAVHSPNSGRKPPSPSPIESNVRTKPPQTSLHFVPMSPNDIETPIDIIQDNSWNHSWDVFNQQSPVQSNTVENNLIR